MADQPLPQPRRGRRRHPRRIAIAITTAVVAVGVGSGIAVAVSGSSGTKYRVATVTSRTVSQTVPSVGTVNPVNQATASFPVSGTIATVAVSVGQTVKAGQTLATLNTTALQQQVSADSAAVAAAQQALATDEASQTATTTTTTATSTATSTAATATTTAFVTSTAGAATTKTGTGSARTGTSTGHTGSHSSPLELAVTRAQQALLTAQRTLDGDLNSAQRALQVCQSDLNALPTTTPSPTPSATPTASPTTTVSASASPTPTANPTRPTPPGGVAGCLAAIASAPNPTRSASDQHALVTDETTLGKAITALAAASATTTPTGTGGSGGSTSAKSGTGTTGSSPATGTKTAGSGAASSAGPASAQQLASDQAQIDAAQANLAVARQNVTEAVLTSPISGKVAANSMVAGTSVSAASTTSTITVIGPGQNEILTSVPLSSIDLVKVGQQASAIVDGVRGALPGKVAYIGILAGTTGSSTTYPVTILLNPTTSALVDGAGAAVTIDITQVVNALTVPNTALHTIGTFSTVTVLKNGKPVVTRVTRGAAGPDVTQITTGLTAGQQVVLATLNTPVPTSNSSATSRITRRLGVTSGSGLGSGGGLTGG